MTMFDILKKIRNGLMDITNFILLLPVYFVGAGVSHIIWRLFYRKRMDEKTFWTKSDLLPKKVKKYLEMY